jgi:hypothetical protein
MVEAIKKKIGALHSLKPWVVYLIVGITMSVVIVVPIGLPISINSYVRAAYEIVEATPAETIVLIASDWEIGSMNDCGYPLISIVQHITQRGMKWVYLSTNAAHPGIWIGQMIPRITPFLEKANYVYGEDYVYLGLIAGGENGLAALADDFWTVLGTDMYGTPLAELPIMANVHTAADFTLLVSANHSPGLMYMRQFVDKYWDIHHISLIIITQPGRWSEAVPYLGVEGGIAGLIAVGGAAAMYESLSGNPGLGLGLTDGQSVAVIVSTLLLVAANVSYVVNKVQTKKEIL